MISNHINRLCLFFGALALSQCTHAAITAVGAGNISDTINSASYRCNVDNGTWIWNAGITLPGVSSCNPIGAPTQRIPQLVSPAADKPTMTHRWWGSVSFLGEMKIGNPADAGFITPDPITARVTDRGVRVMGIPAGLRSNNTQTVYAVPDPFSEVFDGIAVGNTQFSTMEAFLKDYSDGSVTVQWRSGATPVMEATFVQGSPYVYFNVLQGNFTLLTKAADGGEKGVFYQQGNQLGLWTNVAGNRNYFLISGSDNPTFSGANGNRIVVNNSRRLTLALMPNTTTPDAASIQTFGQYALNAVDKVNISYAVNPQTQAVTVKHQYSFQGQPVTTLAGLMPMHWKNSSQAVTPYKVRSAHGVTRFAATSEFNYQLPFVGVLPYLPEAIGDYDPARLRSLIN